MSEKVEGETGRYDIDRFKEEVFKTVDYFAREYKVTYAEIIGSLEIIQQQLIHECNDFDKEDT